MKTNWGGRTTPDTGVQSYLSQVQTRYIKKNITLAISKLLFVEKELKTLSLIVCYKGISKGDGIAQVSTDD